MLPKISESHGAKTQRNSQLFPPQVLQGQVAGRAPSILGRNHFHLPQDRTKRKHLSESLRFCLASSSGGKMAFREGKSRPTCPGSHPNAKQVLAGDHLQEPFQTTPAHTGASAMRTPPGLALILPYTHTDALSSLVSYLLWRFLLFPTDCLRVLKILLYCYFILMDLVMVLHGKCSVTT